MCRDGAGHPLNVDMSAMKTLHEKDIAGMSHTPGEAADTILAAGPGPAGSRLTEPVVVVVGEAAGDPAGEFDEPVHGLGASVG